MYEGVTSSLHGTLAHADLADGFWEPRRRINHEVTLPSQYRHLEDTGRLDNFRRASGKIGGEYQGIYFNDSDVYKWLEAAAWTLAEGADPELERMVDAAITEVEDAQRADGYLNTYFTFESAAERWTDFDLHEMYCAGHLFQAAVAHFRATGSERLLDVASRFADHICDTFGPEEGKRHAVDGHEEVEMALVELFRVTGERKYLEGARYFVDARGYGMLGRPYGQHEPSYSQDHEPLRDQSEVVGHAVRALYLYSGAADVFAETGEPALARALERLWRNLTTRRMYVSGGLGSRYEGEAFGRDFELPNERAYTETCAAIASVMWNWRMLALGGEASYADLIEHTLYNAVLPGLSLDELRDLVLNDKEPTVRFEPDLLGGVAILQAEARSAPPAAGWEDRLYRTVHPRERDTQTYSTRVTLVPYYTWANREPGAMRVWLRNG